MQTREGEDILYIGFEGTVRGVGKKMRRRRRLLQKNVTVRTEFRTEISAAVRTVRICDKKCYQSLGKREYRDKKQEQYW